MDTYEFNESADEQIGSEPPVQPENPIPPVQPVAPQPTPQPQPVAPFMPQTQSQAQTYQETGSVKKESPFANSPYVNAVPVQRSSYPQPPKPPVPPVKPPAPPAKPKRSGRAWQPILAAILLVVAICICIVSVASVNSYWQRQNEQLAKSFEEKLDVIRKEMKENAGTANNSGDSVSGTPNTNVDGGMTPAQVYAENAQSVVAIECTVTMNSFGQVTQSGSSGSGFILTEDGYVVTNYHVVDQATTIKVITAEGTAYEAQYIGGDEANDIALVKVETDGLRAVTVGRSDDLIVGDQVAAIGNPLGELASTLTVGYVSAKDRIVTTDGTQINMLQTDAAINPGNSGGPLFNMKGEVIGITSAKYSGMTSSGATIEGIGFAIPIDDVIGMLEDLQNYGYVTGAFMGVTISDVDPEAAELYGLPMGALVRSVNSGSCAEKAGMKAQDIIVNLGGYEVENLNDLSRALRKFKAGDSVTVTVYRSGAETILTVVLDEKPQSSGQNEVPTTEPGVSDQMPSGGGIEDWLDRFFGN